MLSVREVTKKNQKKKAITRVKIGRNKKMQQKSEVSKSRNGQQERTVLQEPNFAILHFSSLFFSFFLLGSDLLR